MLNGVTAQNRPGMRYAWRGPSILVLDWGREHGDRDGDGYVEYLNPSRFGPPHEGWKDSGNAVIHADGSQAEPPIAPAEIQGYWFTALQFMAVFSVVVGKRGDALAYWREAQELHVKGVRVGGARVTRPPLRPRAPSARGSPAR